VAADEKQMFLITTADQRFWNTEDKVLFLGEWCKLYKDRKAWENLGSQTLAYHWDDRQRFASDKNYLSLVYERYLEVIATSLNDIHCVKFSTNYWRILIGCWLRGFIETLFDRFSSIKTAEESGLVTDTWIGNTQPWVPRTTPDYSNDDVLNQYLYSRIIRKLGTIPFLEQSVSPTLPAENSERLFIKVAAKLKQGPKNIARTIVRFAYSLLPSEGGTHFLGVLSPSVVFSGNIYLSRWDRIRLQLGVKSTPLIYEGKPNLVESGAPSPETRQRLVFPKSSNQFEQLLNELLSEQIPMIYVENYQEMHRNVIAASPHAPKVIFTAFSNKNSHCFEFFAAHSRETYKTKICVAQHGGGYGSAKHVNLDEHVVKSFDAYYTWGSKLNGDPNVIIMPSLRLQTSKQRVTSSNPAGDIMWCATGYGRYKTELETGLKGPHMVQYMKEQESFFSALSSEAQRLVFRRYFGDPWDEKSRLLERFPALKTQEGQYGYLGQTVDFPQRVKECRLVVLTANETTYLETLASNFPTIVFWNPEFYEIRKSLSTYFDQLREVGILHYSPESAAEMVNKIYENPAKWFASAHIQKARLLFCQHLAFATDNWLEVWTKELNRMINGNSVRTMGLQ